MPSGKKRTHEDFIEQLKLQNPSSKDFVVLDRYVSNTSKVQCECKLCGKRWITTPKQLLQDKQKCPNCSRQNKPLTNDEYLERVKKGNPHYSKFIFLSKYEGMGKQIKLQCKECGHIWKTRPFDLASKGVDCPSCSGNATMTDSAFKKKLILKNKNIENIDLLSPYTGVFERIDCRCKICGHIWSPMATSLLQGSGCPKCTKKRIAESNKIYLDKARKNNPAVIQLTNEEFLTKFKDKNHFFDKIECLTPYKGAKQKIQCRCKKCGNIWETFPTTLLQGSGCPECAHTSTSFMEQFIYGALSSNIKGHQVISRDKTFIGKELDIFIPDYNIAIEIGSWKWHKDVYDNDLLKQQLCRDKGITLFIIYDTFTGKKNIKNDLIWTYSFDLSNENQYLSLKKIVNTFLSMLKSPLIENDKEWEDIVDYAYGHSQRVDFNEFMERFKNSNASFENIEIVGKYTKLSAKIKCRCKKCGWEWEPVAFDLLRRNNGCAKCKNKEIRSVKRKINLIAEWRKNNPNGNKKQCHLQTGISYSTVLKWWDSKSN